MLNRTFETATIVAAAALLACTTSGNKSSSKPPESEDKPATKPAAASDASTTAAAATDAAPAATPVASGNTKPVPDKWWLEPDKHCPPGFKLAGNPPPKGRGVACRNDKYKSSGPVTSFHKNGNKSYEGWQNNNKQVGTWTYYYPNGNKRWVVTLRDDGSQDGTYKRWKQDGTLIGQYTLTNGNGPATDWNDEGQKQASGMMKNGKRDGLWTDWHKNGTKAGEETYKDGKLHGPTTRWNDTGKKTAEGRYKDGRFDGRWTYYDAKTGNIERVSIYRDRKQLAVIYYQDGKPLGSAKPALTCGTDDAVSAAMQKVTGRPLPKRHRCIKRSIAFPGVITVGGFAHDRGCRRMGMVIDCAYQKQAPSAATILARVGWKRANLANKKAIARRYIRQVDYAFGGSAPYKESEYTFTPLGNGGLKVSVWIQRPSGMRRGWTKDRWVYTFRASGKVNRRRAESKSGGR